MGVFGGRSVIEGLDGAGVVVTRLGTRVVAANRSARRHGPVRAGGSARALLGDEAVASLRRRGAWPRSVQVAVNGSRVSAHAGAVRGRFGRTSGYLLVWDPADAEQRSREAIGRIAASTDELLGLSATLSRVATDAAEQAQAVSAATEQLTASIAEIARAAAECSAVVADSITVADQAVGGLGRLDASTTEISDVENLLSPLATLAEQLTGALASHAQWRHRLDRAITAAAADITVETAARDDACKFGAWLHSELAQRFGGEARFSEILALHRAFHGAAADVLGHALHGRRDEARAAMAPGTAYAEASAQLSDACRRWLDSLG